MKASEAPEKIYLQDSMSTDTIGDLLPEWFDAKVSDNSIEYTRTDAFIEKACQFIETYPHLFMGVLRSEVIEDFKKYLEEEV